MHWAYRGGATPGSSAGARTKQKSVERPSRFHLFAPLDHSVSAPPPALTTAALALARAAHLVVGRHAGTRPLGPSLLRRAAGGSTMATAAPDLLPPAPPSPAPGTPPCARACRLTGPRPITHALFDMDGLLLDTETCYTTAQAAVLARYGREFSRELKGEEKTPAAKRADLKTRGALSRGLSGPGCDASNRSTPPQGRRHRCRCTRARGRTLMEPLRALPPR